MADLPEQPSAQLAAARGLTSAEPAELARDDARAVFGQVMGLVAFTLGFLALGAYVGRDLTGAIELVFFIAGFGCIFGLNFAAARGREQLAITLLFGLGLLLGLGRGRVLSGGVGAARWRVGRRAGAAGGFAASLGALGYLPRRDLSSWYR